MSSDSPDPMLKAILWTAGGAGAGLVTGFVFITLWTTVFSGVPLNYAWRYLQDDPGRKVLAWGVVGLGLAIGLVAGLVKGVRRS